MSPRCRVAVVQMARKSSGEPETYVNAGRPLLWNSLKRQFKWEPEGRSQILRKRGP